MVSTIKTFTFIGIKAIPVDVEVKIAAGHPAFNIVGLPDKALAESRERVRAAINSIGLEIPSSRITVNLAPADLEKEGSHFDLAITLGMLAEMRIIDKIELVRSKNNVNWMNLMRLAFKTSPQEAEEIFLDINKEDNEISNLLAKLSQKITSYE